jgi:2-polyprenyl-6-methoxyphenol hydroxylase-like FAD-dependent oxidoreductase
MAAQVGLNASVSEARAEVLVVGAGPSGLFSAVELARHGISSRLVEREARPHRQARATALQPATLEILCQAGVPDDTLAASEHLGFARVFDLNPRPDGHVGFRAVPADAAGIEALDAHLASYLVPA